MVDFTIVPCMTNLSQAYLERIGQGIQSAFDGFYFSFTIDNPIRPSGGRIHTIQLDQNLVQVMDNKLTGGTGAQTVWDLTRHLGHVLIYTDLFLWGSNNTEFLTGYQAAGGNPQAIISTAMIKHEPASLLDRLVKLGAHELGHTYGLSHHQPPTDNCFMISTRELAQAIGLPMTNYPRDTKVYDLMPGILCKNCSTQLG